MPLSNDFFKVNFIVNHLEHLAIFEHEIDSNFFLFYFVVPTWTNTPRELNPFNIATKVNNFGWNEKAWKFLCTFIQCICLGKRVPENDVKWRGEKHLNRQTFQLNPSKRCLPRKCGITMGAWDSIGKPIKDGILIEFAACSFDIQFQHILIYSETKQSDLLIFLGTLRWEAHNQTQVVNIDCKSRTFAIRVAHAIGIALQTDYW